MTSVVIPTLRLWPSPVVGEDKLGKRFFSEASSSGRVFMDGIGGIGVLKLASPAIASACDQIVKCFFDSGFGKRNRSHGISLCPERASVRSALYIFREGKQACYSGDYCPLYSDLEVVRFPSRTGLVNLGAVKHQRGIGKWRANTAVSSVHDILSEAAKPHSSDQVRARLGKVSRVTKETSVDVELIVDGTGVCRCDTGIPFLDHMLDQLASHGLFDVIITAKGDIHIDDHHTNEDVGLAVGTALLQALGDRKGINRFGDFTAPLDEALVHVVLDLSGRPYLGYDLQIPTQRIGSYDSQLVEHFFQSFVNTSGMTLHVRQLAGRNSHHIVEATFKAFARALRQATEYDYRRKGSIPSSKGVLCRS